MAKTHTYIQILTTPTGQWKDSGDVDTSDTVTSLDGVVNAYGGGDNAIAIAFTAAGFQSLGLMATVPCVVTLTGATVIDGVTASTVTLAAGILRRISTITGDVTGISVGANTTTSGPAGTIQLSALFNS